MTDKKLEVEILDELAQRNQYATWKELKKVQADYFACDYENLEVIIELAIKKCRAEFEKEKKKDIETCMRIQQVATTDHVMSDMIEKIKGRIKELEKEFEKWRVGEYRPQEYLHYPSIIKELKALLKEVEK